MTERKSDATGNVRRDPVAGGTGRADPATDAAARRPGSKFNAATEGWDAYNSWLDRVRQPAPPSRQAVVAKSLYSVSSYKNWADKARSAFDKGK